MTLLKNKLDTIFYQKLGKHVKIETLFFIEKIYTHKKHNKKHVVVKPIYIPHFIQNIKNMLQR